MTQTLILIALLILIKYPILDYLTRQLRGVNLPKGKVIESSSQIQCVCPVCDYGDGYIESFIPQFTELIPVTCNNCKTKFIGVDGMGAINGVKEN